MIYWKSNNIETRALRFVSNPRDFIYIQSNYYWLTPIFSKQLKNHKGKF